MKNILFAVLFLCFATPSIADPVTFVAATGCKWTEKSGFCIVSNTHKEPIVCDVRTQITTEKDQVTRKTKLILLPGEADDSSTFKVTDPTDKIVTAKIAVKCQLTK